MYKVSKNCRLCNHKNISLAFRFEKMPLSEKYFSKKDKVLISKKYPFSVGFCQKCKNVQTMEIINNKNLWGGYTYFSSQTKAIIDHFKKISSQIISKFKLEKNDLVLDIGSNDGTFLSFFKRKNIKVLGVDPSKEVANVANKKKIKTINTFFNYNISQLILSKYKKPKIITCFNTFAHVEKLNEIVASIKNILSSDGNFIFECQYLEDILKKKILGTFFHEHLYHHSVHSLKNLFNKHDLDLYLVEKVNIQKGSIIGYVKHKKTNATQNKLTKILQQEKKNGTINLKNIKLLKTFVVSQKKKILQILKINNYKGISGYGAARSGPTFIYNYGLEKFINYIFDDHPSKKNKFSSMNKIKILSTKKLNIENTKICIILAYLHQKKIIKKNIKFLQSGGLFICLYPKVVKINLKNHKKYL